MVVRIVKGSSGASLDYYKRQSLINKYFGTWQGELARALGIQGQEVTEETFEKVRHGFMPDGRQVMNAGSPNRVQFWEIVGAVHPSISILLTDPDNWYGALVLALAAGSKRIDSWLNENTQTRLGKGGERIEKADGLFVTFAHFENNHGKPFVHLQKIVINTCRVGVDAIRTITSGNMYFGQREMQALFHSSVGHTLHSEYGLPIVRDRFASAVLGVGPEITNAITTRSAEIKEYMARKGLFSKRSADIAAKVTRTPQAFQPLDKVLARFMELGRKLKLKLPRPIRRRIRNLKRKVDVALLRHFVNRAAKARPDDSLLCAALTENIGTWKFHPRTIEAYVKRQLGMEKASLKIDQQPQSQQRHELKLRHSMM